jgi:small conductance mechanosensitive channel
MNPRLYFSMAIAAVLLLAFSTHALAADAITTADESIDPEKLEMLLEPLTVDDLTTEINAPNGWLTKTKDAGIALAKARTGAEQGDVATLTKAREDLAARLGVVVKALKAKGGDEAVVKGLETYLGAIAGNMFVPGDDEDVFSFGKRLYGWAISAEGGIKWAKNIVFFILIIIAFKILAAILGGIVRKAVGRVKNISSLLRDFFVNTTKNLTFFVGLIVALGVLGMDVGPFVAAIGAVGFIIAFALQGTLSNFAAGIMILLYRPYDLGDVVNVAGVTGKVDAMSLVSTTIKTPDNQVVIVPNNSIWGDVITNITGETTRRVDMVFGIGYGDDMDKAKALMQTVLDGHELILKDPAPVIEVHELADSSVNFVCRPWCKTSDYWTVYWGVTKQVKEKFDAEGVSIPFPQRDIHMITEGA